MTLEGVECAELNATATETRSCPEGNVEVSLDISLQRYTCWFHRHHVMFWYNFYCEDGLEKTFKVPMTARVLKGVIKKGIIRCL